MTIRHRWAAIALLAVACAAFARTSEAAAFDYNDDSWEGGSELLRLARSRLGDNRVGLVATVDFGNLKPEDGLLVLHPTVALMTDALNAFMLSGGRIAILDDFGSSGPFLEKFGIRRTNPPLRPSDTLRGNPNLAWAYPARNSAEGTAQSVHSLVSGVDRLLTNHPTTFTNPGLTPVLEIRAQDGTGYPLGISGVIGQKGRLFVMGDPSTVINLMLRYPENRQYAERVVEYLVEDDSWGVRRGKLYLVANGFAQQPKKNDAWAPQAFTGRLRDSIQALFQWQFPEIAAWILGLVVAAGIGREAWQQLRARSDFYRPRFATQIPLVSQAGEAGRAAVLAARSTPRALVLLEIMSGVSACLAAQLNIAAEAGTTAILEATLKSQLLNQSQRDDLQKLAALVSRIETALGSGGQPHIRPRELWRAHRLMLDIAKSIDHRQRQ